MQNFEEDGFAHVAAMKIFRLSRPKAFDEGQEFEHFRCNSFKTPAELRKVEAGSTIQFQCLNSNGNGQSKLSQL